MFDLPQTKKRFCSRYFLGIFETLFKQVSQILTLITKT